MKGFQPKNKQQLIQQKINITYLVTNISTPKSFPKKKTNEYNQIKQPGFLFLHIFPTHFFPSNPNQLGFPSLGSPCPPHMRSNSVTHQLKGLGSTWIHGFISERASFGTSSWEAFPMKACFLSYFTCWWLNYPSEKYAQVKMGENLPQMFGVKIKIFETTTQFIFARIRKWKLKPPKNPLNNAIIFAKGHSWLFVGKYNLLSKSI